jgi:hypothetical protein
MRSKTYSADYGARRAGAGRKAPLGRRQFVGLRLPPYLYAWVRESARQKGQPISHIVEELLQKAFAMGQACGE